MSRGPLIHEIPRQTTTRLWVFLYITLRMRLYDISLIYFTILFEYCYETVLSVRLYSVYF